MLERVARKCYSQKSLVIQYSNMIGFRIPLYSSMCRVECARATSASHGSLSCAHNRSHKGMDARQNHTCLPSNDLNITLKQILMDSFNILFLLHSFYLLDLMAKWKLKYWTLRCVSEDH